MAKKKDEVSPLWILGGAAGLAVGLYFLFKPKEEEGPGQTEAAPLPPTEVPPPSEFQSLGAVATTFDNVQTNWRMGRLGPREAWDATLDLLEAIDILQANGIGDPASANQLRGDIVVLREAISDYVELTEAA